jgi:hypothetical protein
VSAALLCGAWVHATSPDRQTDDVDLRNRTVPSPPGPTNVVNLSSAPADRA